MEVHSHFINGYQIQEEGYSMRYLVALLFCFAASVAQAKHIPHTMYVGGLTSQPIGHYEFCLRLPDECNIKMRDTGPLHLTGVLWQLLKEVNLHVNNTVKPMDDFDLYGKDEVWTYPQGAGDCEDYALEKRRDLMRLGVPVNILLITVVRKRDGEGHAVLTVRTDLGDYILDNLNDKVVRFDDTHYRYLKRQATDNTGHWVSTIEQDAPLVGSIHR